MAAELTEPIVVSEFNIYSIFGELHKKAIETVEKKYKDYKIINSNFEGDDNLGNFTGAGDNFILVTTQVPELLSADTFKQECHKIISEYYSIYAGPDKGDIIKEDDLTPELADLTDDEKSKIDTEEQKDNNDDAKSNEETSEENNEESSEESSEKNNEESSEKKSANESIKSINSLLTLLFEDQQLDQENAQKENKKIIGYKLEFVTEVGNDKKSSVDSALKRVGKYLAKRFGLEFKQGNVTWSSSFYDLATNKNGIDANTFPSEVHKSLVEKFPGLKESSVNIIDSASIINHLKNKLSSADKKLLSNAEYSVGIKVSRKNKGYEFLNKQVIADIITLALKSKIFKVSKNDIVYVGSYDEENTDNNERFYVGNQTNTIKKESLFINEFVNKLFEDNYFIDINDLMLLTEGHDFSIGQIVNFIKEHGYENIISAKDKILNWVNGKKRTVDGKITQYGKVFGVKAKIDKKTGKVKEEAKPGFYDKFFNASNEDEMIEIVKIDLNPSGRDANKPPETVGMRNAIYQSLNAADIPLKEEEPKEELVKVKIEFKDIDPENPEDETKWTDISEPIEVEIDKLDDIKYPDQPEHEGFKFVKWNPELEELKKQITDENSSETGKDENSNDEKSSEEQQVNDSLKINKSLLNLLFEEDNENSTDSTENIDDNSGMKVYVVKPEYEAISGEEPEKELGEDLDTKATINFYTVFKAGDEDKNEQATEEFIKSEKIEFNSKDFIDEQSKSLKSERDIAEIFLKEIEALTYPDPLPLPANNKQKNIAQGAWKPTKAELAQLFAKDVIKNNLDANKKEKIDDKELKNNTKELSQDVKYEYKQINSKNTGYDYYLVPLEKLTFDTDKVKKTNDTIGDKN